jgi:hypothetical protein
MLDAKSRLLTSMLRLTAQKKYMFSGAKADMKPRVS